MQYRIDSFPRWSTKPQLFNMKTQPIYSEFYQNKCNYDSIYQKINVDFS